MSQIARIQFKGGEMQSRMMLVLLFIVLALTIGACQSVPAPTPVPPTTAPQPTAASQATAAPKPTSAPAASAKLEITALTLGFGVDPVYAPHIVAIKKGWFQEAGFTTVDTKSFTSGALAGEALAAGQIQLWTPGSLPPISMRVNGTPVVIIGTNTAAYIDRFVVRTDATLSKPEDLYNIRIGLQNGSVAPAVLNNIAKKYNLDVNKMKVVNLQPQEQLTSLTNNEIQAMLVWNPWPYLASQTKGLSVTVMHDGTTSYFPWDKGTKFQASFTRSLWVTSEDFIRKNPNAAKALAQVLLRAQKYVRDPANKTEVIQMISEYLKQPVEQNTALWGDYNFDTTFDDTFARDMQVYVDYLYATGGINQKIDPLSFTYTGFVKDFDPSLVKVEGKWKP
jgi:ABC-type nitrate/sulfonate/bicarbonate transport system substrate-binding protein